MMSQETASGLVMAACILSVPFLVSAGMDEWLQFLGLALGVFAFLRTSLYFGCAVSSARVSIERDRVLMSSSAPALGARLRKSFLAPVIEVPVPGVGTARVRFFSSVGWSWMRLRLGSHKLVRSPWAHIEGNSNFIVPAAVVGAKALTPYDPDRHWRYWRLPWRPADPIAESPEFCAALPATLEALVLTSRPGHLLIRTNCGSNVKAEDEREMDVESGVSIYGRNIEFENMVNLAIAWVKAVQQAATEP